MKMFCFDGGGGGGGGSAARLTPLCITSHGLQTLIVRKAKMFVQNHRILEGL
jgi:hypothetical protein